MYLGSLNLPNLALLFFLLFLFLALFQACQDSYIDKFTDWNTACMNYADDVVSDYKEQSFGVCLLVPVMVTFLFTIPHWMKAENTWKRRTVLRK